jgi:GDP-4-dehydro-6-deoxy-D-mannose reductase
MRALVTGADGFAGQWLVKALLRDGDEVAGISRATTPSLTTLDKESAAAVRWLAADIRDGAALGRALCTVRPDVIYHLAGQASVKASFEDPIDTLTTNALGTAALLEAARTETPGATLLAVGSAEAYGAVDPTKLPLREDAPLAPNSPYAASKAAAEMMALQYARAGWLNVVATRSFNHTGPGQSTAFVVAAFAKQFAEMRKGKSPPVLAVGNLTPRRDFLDVRDVVAAYRLLALKGTSGKAYNVSSGHAISLREVVADLSHLSGAVVEIREDPTLVRAVDTPMLIGDAGALRSDTGWQATIPWLRTLQDLYEWFLSQT